VSRRGTAAIWLAVAGLVMTACGARGGDSTTVKAGSLGYAFGAISTFHKSFAGDEQWPADLSEAMPNHIITLGDTGRQATYSDALVVGRVSSVTKGEGVIWGEDEGDYKVVSYDDPQAVTRTANVSMSVEDATGSVDTKTPSISLRVVAPIDADPEKFIEGLAGLDHIVVLLVNDPSAVHKVSMRPIMDGASIGTVSDDGTVSWPGLAEDSKQFAGDLTSIDALLKAARAPDTTTVIKVE